MRTAWDKYFQRVKEKYCEQLEQLANVCHWKTQHKANTNATKSHLERHVAFNKLRWTIVPSLTLHALREAYFVFLSFLLFLYQLFPSEVLFHPFKIVSNQWQSLNPTLVITPPYCISMKDMIMLTCFRITRAAFAIHKFRFYISRTPMPFILHLRPPHPHW